MGTIGGNLGLWVGASIFTLAEFVYGFIGFLRTLATAVYRKLVKKNKIDPNN